MLFRSVARARDAQPDLIILDIMLPYVDGLEVCRQIRRDSTVPIIMLTAKEFELLRLLLSHPNRVFTRDFLLEHIWGYDYYGSTRTVDMHISRLREKIEDDPASPTYIVTVRGVGYKFKAPSDPRAALRN